ncbi:hypothetical protein [Microlunatus parietis]|uniref:Carboxypeptidase regulatory-like domain-containing protein n=1 Tax=Microlunatus parietis TaxID=682979 RepID=A0A7Y9L8B4_9ACTN|nr:hypothetical protein [Microlunatus parietis]NYE70589.1 hypothetical protein [Microlunatus parietis]
MSRGDETLDDLDQEILAAIRDLYAATDPMPDDLPLEIEFQLSVQALHAEVAELQRSSAAANEPVWRDDQAIRTESLTFSCDRLTAMITMTNLDASSVRIDGWVTAPNCRVELRVRRADPGADPITYPLRADQDGRFVIEPVDRGMASFVFVDGTDRPVITPYVEL